MKTPRAIDIMDSLVAPGLVILGIIFFAYVGWVIFGG